MMGGVTYWTTGGWGVGGGWSDQFTVQSCTRGQLQNSLAAGIRMRSDLSGETFSVRRSFASMRFFPKNHYFSAFNMVGILLKALIRMI